MGNPEQSFAVPIPGPIKRQVDKGMELLKQANDDTAKATIDPATVLPAAIPDPKPVVPAAQQDKAPAAPPVPIGQEVPAVAVDKAPPQPAAPVPPQPQTVDLAQINATVQKLTSELNTLRGKYDSEVPRLHTQNRELDNQLRQALQENAQLRQAQQQTQQLSEGALKWFSDEINPEYAQKLQEFVAGVVSPLQQQVEGAKQETAESRKEQFYAEITRAHPDWREVNLRWLEWLVTPMPPLYQETFDQALQKAQASLNANAVIRIFQAFKDHEASQQQAAQAALQPGPVVLPGSGGGGGTPVPEKRRYTQSQIQLFYNELRKIRTGNRSVYTPEQAAALEQDIYAAQREGRVDPG